MRGSVRPCWTGSRIGLTFWRRARNRIGSGGRRKSEIDQPKRRRAKTTSCGNGGPWKAWKTQEQVSHSSHRPWKSARAADSHIHHSYGGGDCSGCGSPHTASLKQQHPKVGRNKPPKWAKRSCQTHLVAIEGIAQFPEPRPVAVIDPLLPHLIERHFTALHAIESDDHSGAVSA